MPGGGKSAIGSQHSIFPSGEDLSAIRIRSFLEYWAKFGTL